MNKDIIIPLCYWTIAITLFLIMSTSIVRSEASRRKRNSPYGTEGLILFSLIFCSTWIFTIPIISILAFPEFLRERRVKNGDPYIMPYGKYVFERELSNPIKLEKKLFGKRLAGKFPFIVSDERIEEFRSELKNQSPKPDYGA